MCIYRQCTYAVENVARYSNLIGVVIRQLFTVGSIIDVVSICAVPLEKVNCH